MGSGTEAICKSIEGKIYNNVRGMVAYGMLGIWEGFTEGGTINNNGHDGSTYHGSSTFERSAPPRPPFRGRGAISHSGGSLDLNAFSGWDGN